MRLCRRFICNPCSCKESSLRNVSFDAVLPIFMVPILLLVASQNVICTVLVFLTSPLFVYYLYINFLRFLMRTKFFLMWTLSSVFTLMLVFEISVVPQLEILPEENLVFVICVVGGLASGYETRRKSDHSNQESSVQTLELGEANQDICGVCKKQASSKTVHCRLCQTCVLGREYHCHWLDCCIGSSNIQWFLLCLFFSAAAFIYGSNLTMTSVCHPFILVGTVLLPDDCSDVYYQIDIAVCFVSSIYSLLIGLVLFIYLVYHAWSLCFGKTKERYLLNSESQHNGEIIKNAVQLFCCKS